jgi:hypothetical protein
MDLSKVNTLLEKLESQRHELEAVDFGREICDFSVVELEALSASLDRVIQHKPLTLA